MIFQHGLKQNLRQEFQSCRRIIPSTRQMANLEKTKRTYFIIVPVVIISLLVWYRLRGELKIFGDLKGGWLFKTILLSGWWLLLTVAHSYQHDITNHKGTLKMHLFMARRLAIAFMFTLVSMFVKQYITDQ